MKISILFTFLPALVAASTSSNQLRVGRELEDQNWPLCHRTDSDTNPYSRVPVSKQGYDEHKANHPDDVDLCAEGTPFGNLDHYCNVCTDNCDCTDVGEAQKQGGGGGGGPRGACFSALASVQVRGKGTVAMKDLQVGDYVLTSKNYEPVYSFGHYNPSKSATFFQIHHSKQNADRPLEVTADHLIFLQGKSSPVPAHNLQVGDVLRGATGGSTITRIGSVERTGIYAPLTTGGSLLVNGVTASSYIQVTEKEHLLSDHDLIHLTLSPYRFLCNSVSATFCDSRLHNKENGMPYYVYHGLELLQWLFDSRHPAIQTVVLTAIVLACVPFVALEYAVGSGRLTLMLLAFLGSVIIKGRNEKKIKTV